MGPGWGDRRRPRRQANAFQVPTDGPRVGESCHDLHWSAAALTYAQIKWEHPCQQHCPGQSMPSLRRCGLRLTAAGVGLLVSCFRTRHDLRPVGGMGRQHAMIAHQIQPRRRHQGGQLLEQFLGGSTAYPPAFVMIYTAYPVVSQSRWELAPKSY